MYPKGPPPSFSSRVVVDVDVRLGGRERVSSHVAAIPGRILLPRKKSGLATTLPQDMEPVYLLLDLGA